MRVSDADRAQIADRLAKHYGDGRLDQAEFELRLDKTMRATTVADLSGLLADLPGEQSADPPVPVHVGSGPLRYQRRLLKLQLERERLVLKREQHELRRRQRAAGLPSMLWVAVFTAFLVAAYLVARAITHWIGCAPCSE
jgi:Domain of unknown function (DUF1707)